MRWALITLEILCDLKLINFVPQYLMKLFLDRIRQKYIVFAQIRAVSSNIVSSYQSILMITTLFIEFGSNTSQK